jgi:hypothetical protein
MNKLLTSFAEPLFIAAIFLVLIIGTAHGQGLGPNQRCADWATANEWQLATTVVISGDSLTRGNWTVEHNTITVQFGTEPPLVWDQTSVAPERLGALMDWIATALHYEVATHEQTLAGRTDDGQIWLISQIWYESSSEPKCLAHPLDQLGRKITTPGTIIEHTLDTQLQEAP